MGTTPNRSYPYPAYTDPQDVRQAIEDLALAVDADMATINGEIGLALNSPSVSVFNTSSQSVASGAAGQILDWTGESYNNDAMYDPIAPDRITFTTTGIYWLTCMVLVAPTADAAVRDGMTEFVSSGISTPTPTSQSLRLDDIANTAFTLAVPHIVIAGGETLMVRFTHDAAAALNVVSTRLNVSRLARLLPL